MAASSNLKHRKLHVNLTLRADLYGLAREHAKGEGMSVSAFIERILMSLAQDAVHAARDLELEPDLAALRGVLKGPLADWSKQEARAARHEARLGKGGA